MYKQVNKLNDAQFRRKTGVKRNTFNKMVEIVRGVEEKRKKILGRPKKTKEVLLRKEKEAYYQNAGNYRYKKF